MVFISVLLAHLVGDFLLQPKAMALQKSEKGSKGILVCTLHVIMYTSIMMFALVPFVHTKSYGLLYLLIAVPHWIIDRFSLANKWSELIKGRTFETVQTNFDIAFTAVVYTIIDGTFHLISLFVIIYIMK
jgi:hypothetical protein